MIRHAKAERYADTDFERPLSERGISDCAKVAKVLASQNFMPDKILLSPSKRTMETADEFIRYLNWPEETIELNRSLYLGSCSTLLQEIRKTGENIESLCLIGHNDGITELFNSVSDMKIDNMPTCSVGIIVTEEIPWQDWGKVRGKLRFYSDPKRA